jgi:hypothetical protein
MKNLFLHNKLKSNGLRKASPFTQMIHKIVDHTLTMKQATTMITRIYKIIYENVFDNANWPLFDKLSVMRDSNPVPNLTVIEFIAERSNISQDLGEIASAAGTEAMILVKEIADKEYRTWLFVAHGPWQAINRIVRHKKLWKEHHELVSSCGVLNVGEETEIESHGRIRFAGLLEVTGDSFAKAINLVRTNSACAIICSKRPNIDSQTSVRSIFLSAFPKTDGMQSVSVDWMTLATALCPQGDILIRVNGLFDDREVAVDVIASADFVAIPEQSCPSQK